MSDMPYKTNPYAAYPAWILTHDMAPVPAADQRHPWLRYQIKEYTEGIRHSYEQRLETIWSRLVNRVHVLDFEGFTPKMRQDLAVRLRMVYSGEGMSDTEMGLDVTDTLCFQLGGVRRRMTWRQFILALGLHREQEMAEAGFRSYWTGSDRLILDKGDLRDYSIKISSNKDFLGPTPFYVLIRDPVRRLCHRMIAYNISDKGQAPEKVVGVDLFYLRNMDRPERQQATAVGSHEADEAGPAAKEGAQEIPALTQASPPPPPAPQPRTMS
ncbi:hypothetical protein Tco_1034033 [Tanacetum coccineum]